MACVRQRLAMWVREQSGSMFSYPCLRGSYSMSPCSDATERRYLRMFTIRATVLLPADPLDVTFSVKV